MVFAGAVVTLLSVCQSPALEQVRPADPCRYPCKQSRPKVGPGHSRTVVAVKFRDGMAIRAVDGRVTDVAVRTDRALTAGEKQALARLPIARWMPAHDAPPAALDKLRREAEENLQRRLPDLTLQYIAVLEPGADPEEVLDDLNALPCTEMAQPVPRPAPPPLPPAFEAVQHELAPAPAGIGAAEVWSWPGGGSHGVRIADVEYAWNLGHNDLPAGIAPIGTLGPDPFNNNNHGTAVLGILGAVRNGWGTSGAAHNATLSVVSALNHPFILNIEGAITRAAVDLAPGDVILIEQQIEGPLVDGTTFDTQWGMVPAEWYRPVYDAILIATGAGRVVVEAAGNGWQDLDGPAYTTGNGGHHPFALGQDSGAILVGAGHPPTSTTQPDRSRINFSNYGSRVSVQAAGLRVVTLGFGDLYNAEGPHRRYTQAFGGTSSAAAIVAAAASVVQAMHIQARGAPVSPTTLRAALIVTGSAQVDGELPAAQRIGPRPDVRAAAFYLLGATDCNQTGVPDALEDLPEPTVSPAAGTITAWTGGRATLRVAATAESALDYRWERNGAPLEDGEQPHGSIVAGAHTPELILTALRADDAGSYACIVRNACDLEASAVVTLVVNPGCAADVTGEGTLSPEDLFEFFQTWFRSEPRADVNADGVVSLQDIFVFLETYFAGCP